MRDVIDMWKNTRMVVLTAMTASLYAAILIPFKVMPLIPGVTEFRPANAVPVVCSFLFGPAAAWGTAIGNVIGDFFGGLGPGDLFGFVGNFLYGLLPYKIWRAFTDADPIPTSVSSWILFVAVVLLSAAACGVTIGWGLNLLGFVPFKVLANIILVNNGLVAVVLSPLLLAAIYPRVKRARLRYEDIMTGSRRRHSFSWVGVAVVFLATVATLVVGNRLPTEQVGLGLLPLIALLLLGAALL